MTEKYSLRDAYALFLALSLFLPVNCVLILICSSLIVAGEPFAAGVGFLTLSPLMAFIYVYDRWNVSEEDRINSPERTALVLKYHTELLWLAVAALALFEVSLLVPLSAHGPVGALYVALGHVPLAVLAVYDEVKSLPLPMDSLAVGFAWSFEVAFVFAFVAPVTPSAVETVALFVGWFLVVFAGVESRNVEDVEGDRKAGKQTLAVLFGPGVATQLSVMLKLAGAAVLVGTRPTVPVLLVLGLHLVSLRFYRRLELGRREGSGAPPAGTDRSDVGGTVD